MVAGGRQKDLRLVLEAAKGLGVQDPVAVALKDRPQVAMIRFVAKTAPGFAA